VFQLSDLPWLPGALDYGRAGTFPGGMDNNARHFGQWVDFAKGIDYLYQDMLYTPETSGGLLIALPPESVSGYLEQIPYSTVVGIVTHGNGRIWVKP